MVALVDVTLFEILEREVGAQEPRRSILEGDAAIVLDGGRLPDVGEDATRRAGEGERYPCVPLMIRK
jgi:hypothetical protein